MSQVELAHMTWKEAAAARDRGAVVLIPIGTQEQNGTISPLGSDTLAAVEVANRAAQETGSLVAPTISYGYSPIFRHYPGSVCLRPDTLRALILDVCENLIENGFDRLLLVNCHNGNEPIMEHAAREIRERLGVMMGFFNPINLAQAASKDLYAGKESALGHGSEPIASMLRSFTPGSVRPEAGRPGDFKDFQGLPVPASSRVKVGGVVFGLYFNNEEVMETGGTGDPTISDPERGAEIMRRTVALAISYIQVFARLKTRQ